jgi:hypothetical protein
MRRLQELALGGGSHFVTDWINNEYQAFISQFEAGPSGSLVWSYDMKLQVNRITKLRGAPYVGRR